MADSVSSSPRPSPLPLQPSKAPTGARAAWVSPGPTIASLLRTPSSTLAENLPQQAAPQPYHGHKVTYPPEGNAMRGAKKTDIALGALFGAIVGAAVFGPIGALVGAIIGAKMVADDGSEESGGSEKTGALPLKAGEIVSTREKQPRLQNSIPRIDPRNDAENENCQAALAEAARQLDREIAEKNLARKND